MSQIFKPLMGSFTDFRCPQMAELVSMALGDTQHSKCFRECGNH